jgi:hypothetical protein
MIDSLPAQGLVIAIRSVRDGGLSGKTICADAKQGPSRRSHLKASENQKQSSASSRRGKAMTASLIAWESPSPIQIANQSAFTP